MLNREQIEIVRAEDALEYGSDIGIDGADQIYIYYFKDPGKLLEQDVYDICEAFGEYMISAYFLNDVDGPYEKLQGDEKGGYKKVFLQGESQQLKQEMFRLFIEGDYSPYLNRLFLFKQKIELDCRKQIELEDGMAIIAPILDVRAIGIFSKGIDLVRIFQQITNTELLDTVQGTGAKSRLIEDHNENLRNEIGYLVDYKAVLPKQIFKKPELYDFYFTDFFHCYDDDFINDLNKIGQLLKQESVRLFTPHSYYETIRKFIFKKIKQIDVPYAELSIDITEKEYGEILWCSDTEKMDFVAFDYLYWYFNSDCFIFGDKESEISILAIKKSLSIKNPLENWKEVELFAANPGEEWCPWLKDEEKFLAELIANYRNGNEGNA
ncbi:hypothetical protein [Listeria marthii]|uniref:hypothetical protein n=1 Tax=Listeria marthii TaxID=529731 RepID=UPI00162973B8|nr:hypothetical protein [Listeria marthii]